MRSFFSGKRIVVFGVVTCFVVLFSTFALQSHASDKHISDALAKRCDCTNTSLEAYFDQVTHVVFGEVKDVTNQSRELATGDFRAMQVFKGSKEHVLKVVGAAIESQDHCRIRLEPGYYLVFTDDAQNVVINRCGASRLLKDDLVTTLTAIKLHAEGQSSASSQQKQASASTMQKKSAEIEQPELSTWERFTFWLDSLFE